MSEKPLRNNTAKFYIHTSLHNFLCKFELLSWFWLFMAFQLGAIEKFVFYVTVRHFVTHRNIVYAVVPLYRSTFRIIIHFFTFVIMRCSYSATEINFFSFVGVWFRFFFLSLVFHTKIFSFKETAFLLRGRWKKIYFSHVSVLSALSTLFPFLFFFFHFFLIYIYETCVSWVMINFC